MAFLALTDIERSAAFVTQQLQLHGIQLSSADITHTTQHWQLLTTHAEQVMAWPLPDQLEPAPIFTPTFRPTVASGD